MQRLAIAAAAMSAAQFAPSAVLAESTLTLYGRVEMSIDHIRVKSSAGARRTERGVSSDASRIGLRGSEDLGGGLRANFGLEGGIVADTGAAAQGGSPWGRGTWVGLEGR